MTVAIRKYKESDRNNWNEYVLNHADGSVFHLTHWKEVIEQAFGHKSLYLIAENGNSNSSGQIVGIFPIFIIKSFLFGKYLVSVPFAELGGPLSDDDHIQKKLLEKAESLAADEKADYLELRNRTPIDGYPTKSLYYNFKREIFPNLDDNMKAIPRKARRMIRVGEKKGLVSEMGHHLANEHYAIMAKSYHSLGTPTFPKKLYAKFLDIFGDKAHILRVRNENKVPVAAVMSFFFKDQLVPYWAGSVFEYRDLAPNDFMYWELMKYGCENGFKVFDFGRSKEGTGSFDFKRHWGFEPVQLAYQYHLVGASELPNLSPNNPKYRKKIEMWRKMPHFATKLIGPGIAKYLA